MSTRHLPRELPRHKLVWPDQRITMWFRLIPAGTFLMGSRGYSSVEEPAHRVEIPEPFWMAETPVTQAQFALWTRAVAIEHEHHFGGKQEHPAENMDWRQAVSYCEWLTCTQKDNFPEDFKRACLPTEAEWEYACRAGTDTDYYTGDGAAVLAEAGWFDEDWNSGSTHPVGKKTANQYGLHDMHGNVWEWCHDVWDDAAYRARVDGLPDPGIAPRASDWRKGLASMKESAQSRVLRGGSWDDSAGGCRSACRTGRGPDGRCRSFGFRVCLVRGPAVRQPVGGAEAGPGDGGRGTRPESDGPGEATASAVDLARVSFPRAAGQIFYKYEH